MIKKIKYLAALSAALLLSTLSGCSESEQPSVSNVAGTEAVDAIEINSGESIKGSLDLSSKKVDTQDNDFGVDRGAVYDAKDFAVNAVTPQLEQQSEQLSVSELEQITEADNQALQTEAELKTVDEAQSLAATHAKELVDEIGDTITPLAETAVTSETMATSKVAQAEAVVPETPESEVPQSLLASSGLRTYDPVRGTWIKKKQKIAGEWLIEIRSGEAYLVLGEDFKTRSAPDLKFVLSKTSIEDVNSKNALDGSLFVANLESPSGEQTYKLPSNFDEYSTLLLHCEKYTKLWGAASINLRP